MAGYIPGYDYLRKHRIKAKKKKRCIKYKYYNYNVCFLFLNVVYLLISGYALDQKRRNILKAEAVADQPYNTRPKAMCKVLPASCVNGLASLSTDRKNEHFFYLKVIM